MCLMLIQIINSSIRAKSTFKLYQNEKKKFSEVNKS